MQKNQLYLNFNPLFTWLINTQIRHPLVLFTFAILKNKALYKLA